jgi:hypothetical protein
VASRRRLKSALRGFLGTYSSRYSDYDGYWMFGLIEPQLDGLSVDLLSELRDPPSTPVAAALGLAKQRFREQLTKAKLPFSAVSQAQLSIAREASERGPVHGHYTAGHRFTFSVHAVSDRGKAFHDETTIFVAPHDPRFELRSRRRT